MHPVIAGILVILTVIVGYIVQKFLKHVSPPPGQDTVTNIPPGLKPSDPKGGNNEDIARAGSLHQFLSKLHKDYGKIVSFWMGEEFMVSIASPQLFKEHAKIFDKPVSVFLIFEPLFTKHSIAYINGKDGKRRRAVYDPAYSHKAVSQDHLPIFLQIGKETMEEYSDLPPGEQISVEKTMFQFSIKSMCETSLGKAFRSNEQVNELKQLYDQCWHHVEGLVSKMTPSEEEIETFEKSRERLFAIIQGVLDERRHVKDGTLLIDVIMSGQESDDVVVGDTMTYFIGGFHTTGLMLTWCMYHLACEPDIQEKCYKELVDVLADEPIDGSVINDLKYMRQFVDETLRWSTLGPYGARCRDVDSKLGGYSIPAETPVIHALGVVMEDEDIWTNPSVFDPDRFEEAPDTYSFVPFGFAGGRKCPGYRFSYMEGYVFLSEFLRKFKVKLAPGQNKKVGKVFGLVTRPSEEIYVCFEKR